jgi:uncharacterized membrane protein YeaQ/YmgE (transglycosylase-associated protein family)
MSLLWTAIVGLIAGALAKLIMPGKDPGGIWITMGLGVGGAVVANIIGNALGWYSGGGSAGIIGSTIGAVLILAIYRAIKGRKAPAST